MEGVWRPSRGVGFYCLVILWLSCVVVPVWTKTPCLADRLTVYKVVMRTYWSRETFPKHYPDWRPPAHWSKLVGRSHNESFHLFRVNEKASEGLRDFAEKGTSAVLDELSQGEGGIYDEFNAPLIPHGVGRTEAEFFVDGNHSRVSLISKITPSPDWFVGVNAYDLCNDGRWVDSVTIEADPLDAGTDSGLTFTSPNWKTEPQDVITRITSRNPNHPASSFYYKEFETLPPVASFQFLKVKEYELSQVFHHPELEISNNEVTSPGIGTMMETNLKSVYVASSIRKQIPNQITTDYFPRVTNQQPFPPPSFPVDATNVKNPFKKNKKMKKSTLRHKKRRHRKIRPPRDCRVSDWSEWSPCSKTCGLGEMTRSRSVVLHARRGGRPCPPLKQAKWCGSARYCSKKYFNWR